MEGQRKRFDLETQDTISLAVELQKLETVPVSVSQSTRYRRKQELLGWRIQKPGNNGHLHVAACS